MNPGPRQLVRRSAATLLALLTLTGVALSPATAVAAAPPVAAVAAPPAAPPTCPNPDQPSLDYLCPLGPTYVIPGLTDLAGWNDPSHYTNILTGDVTGDGQDELIVRGVAGTQVYRFDTAAGQWSQISVNPILPDSDGWATAPYYSTIRLGDLDNDGRDELVARSAQGIVVYRYTPGTSPDAGTWTQLTTSGPMADANGWQTDPSYYSTIQLVPLGSFERALRLMARGSDGLHLWSWNGSGWDPLPTLTDLSDDNGWKKPEYYTTIHAWNNLVLFARGPQGLRTYAFGDPTPGQWSTYGTTGPFKDTDCFSNGLCWSSEAYYSSILPVNGYGGGDSNNPVVMGRSPNGVKLYIGSPGDNGGPWEWDEQPANLPNGTEPMTDADGFNKPESYRTIQLADVIGDGRPELVGRTSAGMVTYRFDREQNWIGPLGVGTPALTDDPWKDPAYYSTISTARFGSNSALIARGPSGLRTWRFDTTALAWARYRPYGNFPAIDPSAMAAITQFLGLATGTIRDVYTSPAGSPTSDQLASYQSSLAARCTNLQSANPPNYGSCTPPGNSSVPPAIWTTGSNQIIAELFWARQVIDYHTTLNDIQTTLFLDQDSEFPAIAADLKLAQAATIASQKSDYEELFSSIFGLLSLLPVPPGLQQVFAITSGALSVASAATPSLDGSSPTQFDHTFAQMQNKIATIQQETQDVLTAHQRHVMGDYGLLKTVGGMVAAQVWKLDKAGALSAARQSFTLWVYQGMLPVLWDRWTVHHCDSSIPGATCFPPPNGGWMNTYTQPPDATFDGFVPHQTPCHPSFQMQCHWTGLAEQGYSDTWTTLTSAVTQACTYDPTAGRSWQYGSCSLGVPTATLFTLPPAAPWNFSAYACTADQGPAGIDPSECVRAQPHSVASGKATHVGTANGSVRLVAKQKLHHGLDLRGATIQLNLLLHERRGAREIVGRPNGGNLLPYMDTAGGSATKHRARFRTPAGAVVEITGTLKVKNGVLRIELALDGAALDTPQLCGATQHTYLGTHLFVTDGKGRRVQILDVTRWLCDGQQTLSY